MNEIKIQQKDDNISFEEIHKLLLLSHQKNINNGLKMTTAFLNGEEIEKRIGKDGVCFIALDNNKLVGTISVRFVERNVWYTNKKIIPDYILAGVLPEYQGKHINTMLSNEVFNYIKNLGYDLIELDTAENNFNAIEVYKHLGFKKINFKSFDNVDHYSVVMVKWFYKCPFSNLYCRVRYNFRRFFVKLRYKKGKVKRFGI